MAGVRLAARAWFDGTMYYDGIVVPLCMDYIALYMVAVTVYICKRFPEFAERLTQREWFCWLEKNSFYIYLVHTEFLDYGIYRDQNLWFATITFVGWFFTMTVVLRTVVEQIYKIKC